MTNKEEKILDKKLLEYGFTDKVIEELHEIFMDVIKKNS